MQTISIILFHKKSFEIVQNNIPLDLPALKW